MDGSPSDIAREVEILLVEDNPGDIRLVKEAFEDDQIENDLHVVKNGKEALNFLYQRENHTDAPRPDLILLDLNIPTVSGEDVLAEIKGEPDLKHIPVIVLSGSKMEQDILRSYNLNANAYLTKPVEPEAFIELVQSFKKFWLSVARLPPRDKEEES